MQVIGKGKLLWNKYTEYVSKENELSARKKLDGMKRYAIWCHLKWKILYGTAW